jgi:SAM-dependent methyltransferase
MMMDLLRRYGIAPPGQVLDAGCGWGTNLALLERAGYAVTGLDISRRALEGLDCAGRHLIEADLTKDLPAEVQHFDAVLALDVIEHIDDDRAAVARLGSLLKPKGYLVISVPALPELYSEFDEVQGHRRRYTRESLASAFAGTGLEISQMFWWGQWMARLLARRKTRTRARTGETAAAIYRRYLSLPPWPAPFIMKFAFGLDHGRSLRGANRYGTSLFAVASRPAL